MLVSSFLMNTHPLFLTKSHDIHINLTPAAAEGEQESPSLTQWSQVAGEWETEFIRTLLSNLSWQPQAARYN